MEIVRFSAKEVSVLNGLQKTIDVQTARLVNYLNTLKIINHE